MLRIPRSMTLPGLLIIFLWLPAATVAQSGSDPITPRDLWAMGRVGAPAIHPDGIRIAYLEEGDWVELRHGGATVFDEKGREVAREVRESAVTDAMMGKGNYRHFMLKEIYEQPTVIGDTLNVFFNPAARKISLPDLPFDLAKISEATVIACGTSFYAGMTAQYWLERFARIPVSVDVASEFRYREAPMRPDGLALFISQSGETADTLAALRYARAQGQHIVSIVNVPMRCLRIAAPVSSLMSGGPFASVAPRTTISRIRRLRSSPGR